MFLRFFFLLKLQDTIVNKKRHKYTIKSFTEESPEITVKITSSFTKVKTVKTTTRETTFM